MLKKTFGSSGVKLPQETLLASPCSTNKRVLLPYLLFPSRCHQTVYLSWIRAGTEASLPSALVFHCPHELYRRHLNKWEVKARHRGVSEVALGGHFAHIVCVPFLLEGGVNSNPLSARMELFQTDVSGFFQHHNAPALLLWPL